MRQQKYKASKWQETEITAKINEPRLKITINKINQIKNCFFLKKSMIEIIKRKFEEKNDQIGDDSQPLGKDSTFSWALFGPFFCPITILL